jgi:hypothetical protein
LFKFKRTLEVLILLAASILSLLPALTAPGWPENHEKLRFIYRTELYLDHLKQGDIVPNWAAADNFGFGSPYPGIYHRWFYWSCAIALWITGRAKVAVGATIVCFLGIGAVGVAHLSRAVGARGVLPLLAGSTLIFANYTVTEWLVRGAVAEFSLMMLLPWLLLWFVRLVKTGQWSWAIVPLFALCYLAHSALAFAVSLILIASGTLFLPWHWRGWICRRNVLRAPVSTMLLALIIAPFAAVSLMLSRSVQTDAFLKGWHPYQHARHWWEYIYDPKFVWGARIEAFTVQLDSAVLAALVMSMCWLIIHRIRPAFLAAQLALTVVASLALVLQLGKMGWVYEIVPGLVLLQFPWRLLALIVPAAIAGTFGLLGEIMQYNRRLAATVGLGCAVITIALSGALRQFPHRIFYTGRLPQGWMEQPEYLPRIDDLGSADTVRMLIEWSHLPPTPCVVEAEMPIFFESLSRTYDVSCPEAGIVRLPVLRTGAARIHASSRVRLMDASRVDPRVSMSVPAGYSQITVEFIRFTDVLFGGGGLPVIENHSAGTKSR